MRTVPIILITLLAAPMAWADAITIDGERREGVFIHATERVVFVHDPEDGSVQPFLRRDLDDDAIEYAEDASERAALENGWALARDARRATEDAKDGALPLPRPHAQVMQQLQAQTAAPETAERRTDLPVSDGIVPRVDLRDVPLGTALKAMLRPMGLDFEVREGMVYISDPETLRTESWEPLEVRVYDIKNFDATLPKIVVMNPGGRRFPVTGQGAFGQGAFGPGGFGQGVSGQGGFGQGQFPQSQFPQTGAPMGVFGPAAQGGLQSGAGFVR